ncbi:hypothetical protein B0H11DRAFT_2423711 [Mycena galericulata]|nr:hypothetical protein B0H11DRAFT_2423711 [Mycena galericulata]
MSSLCANILRTLGTWGRVIWGRITTWGLGFDGDRRDGVDTGSISTRTGYETVERYIIDAPIRARNRRWFAAYTPGIAPYVPYTIRSEKLRIRVYGTGRYGPAPYTYGGSRVQPQGLRWKRKSTLARVRIGYTPRREATGTTYVVPELHQCEGWQAADVFSVRRWVPGCCAYTGGHFNTLSHIPKWRVPPLDAKAAHQSKCAVLCPNVLPS